MQSPCSLWIISNRICPIFTAFAALRPPLPPNTMAKVRSGLMRGSRGSLTACLPRHPQSFPSCDLFSYPLTQKPSLPCSLEGMDEMDSQPSNQNGQISPHNPMIPLTKIVANQSGVLSKGVFCWFWLLESDLGISFLTWMPWMCLRLTLIEKTSRLYKYKEQTRNLHPSHNGKRPGTYALQSLTTNGWKQSGRVGVLRRECVDCLYKSVFVSQWQGCT